MLEIRQNCEQCKKPLANDAVDALICSFECTFCKSCVEEILLGICPNCGGNFTQRPIRPTRLLNKYPASNKLIYKPVEKEAHLKKWKII